MVPGALMTRGRSRLLRGVVNAAYDNLGPFSLAAAIAVIHGSELTCTARIPPQDTPYCIFFHARKQKWKFSYVPFQQYAILTIYNQPYAS